VIIWLQNGWAVLHTTLMRGLEFPIIGTKVKSLNKKFDINSPEGRKEYFEAKAGREIGQIRDYLKERTFIAYMLGKKGSGKGTYSKLFTEIFGEEKVATVSVGDLIREADDWENFKKTEKYGKLKKYYRGYMSFENAVDAHLSRSTSKLLPTEFILALVKAHIDGMPKKSIFIDGLPRDMDQVSYSLYFRDLIAYRDDPDMFVLIDIPESVIDARIKTRVVCPKCNLSRNLKLLPTKNIRYDTESGKFLLLCDNPNCPGCGKEVLKGKEGDDKGIEPIRGRLDKDEAILKSAFNLYGIPKILLRNHVPVFDAKKYHDDYELTNEFDFTIDKNGKIKSSEKPWTISDDNRVKSYSLMAAPVVVVMLKQMAEILND
jgi:adenylate kinase family enzyme